MSVTAQPLVHLEDARLLGCGVLAVPRSGVGQGCGVLAVLCGTVLPHCSAMEQDCPPAAPRGRPGQLCQGGRCPWGWHSAGAAGGVAAECPRCQHCPGDRSRAGLMIDPRVTPRPPGAAGKGLSRARDRDGTGPILMEFLRGSQVSCGLVGLPRAPCGATPGRRAHLCHSDARCQTKECVGCCWGAGWSLAGLGPWGHGQRGLGGLGDQKGHGDVEGMWQEWGMQVQDVA